MFGKLFGKDKKSEEPATAGNPTADAQITSAEFFELLGLCWALSPGDRSNITAIFSFPETDEVTTTASPEAANGIFWARMVSLNCASDGGKLVDGLKDKLSPEDFAAAESRMKGRKYSLTALGRKTAAALLHGLQSGYPPNEALISEPCLQMLQIYADRGPAAAVAQNKIGALYLEGRGVPKDEARAVHWFQYAAVHEDQLALNNLGIVTLTGLGTPQNTQQAIAYFHRAAKVGSTGALDNLGEIYLRKYGGIEQDLYEAKKWLQHAADAGHLAACWKLGQFYLQGIGCEQNFKQAYIWLTLASIAKFDVEKPLQQAMQRLSDLEIEQAQTYIKDWKPKKFEATSPAVSA